MVQDVENEGMSLQYLIMEANLAKFQGWRGDPRHVLAFDRRYWTQYGRSFHLCLSITQLL